VDEPYVLGVREANPNGASVPNVSRFNRDMLQAFRDSSVSGDCGPMLKL
jgi:hypothetical protein